MIDFSEGEDRVWDDDSAARSQVSASGLNNWTQTIF